MDLPELFGSPHPRAINNKEIRTGSCIGPPKNVPPVMLDEELPVAIELCETVVQETVRVGLPSDLSGDGVEQHQLAVISQVQFIVLLYSTLFPIGNTV